MLCLWLISVRPRSGNEATLARSELQLLSALPRTIATNSRVRTPDYSEGVSMPSSGPVNPFYMYMYVQQYFILFFFLFLTIMDYNP